MKGLLLKDKLPNKFKKLDYIWSKIKILKKKEKINNLACCLQFIKRYSRVDKILIGIENIKQTKEIINELKINRNINTPNIKCYNKKMINPNLW